MRAELRFADDAARRNAPGTSKGAAPSATRHGDRSTYADVVWQAPCHSSTVISQQASLWSLRREQLQPSNEILRLYRQRLLPWRARRRAKVEKPDDLIVERKFESVVQTAIEHRPTRTPNTAEALRHCRHLHRHDRATGSQLLLE